jgi:hypothetical protein
LSKYRFYKFAKVADFKTKSEAAEHLRRISDSLADGFVYLSDDLYSFAVWQKIPHHPEILFNSPQEAHDFMIMLNEKDRKGLHIQGLNDDGTTFYGDWVFEGIIATASSDGHHCCDPHQNER